MLQRFHFVSKILVVIMAIFSLSSCGGTNLFQAASGKNSDEALLISAQQKINSGDYDDALEYLDQITSGFRQDPAVIQAIVGANLGKCGGLTFLELFENMGTAAAGSPMMMFMNMFQLQTVSPVHCYNAQIALESKYGTNSSARTTDINLYMAVLGIAKMGTYLRNIADADQDGATDATFTDACTNSNANITDSEVRQVGSGFGMLLDNLSSLIAATGGTSTLTDLDNIKTACGASCIITDPSAGSWNAASINTIRDILDHQDTGISTCADPTFVTCCP